MRNARLFIRDDDVWTVDRPFRFFFDQAIGCRLPAVYAVIPGKMEKGLIRFLCRAKEKNPHLLDIVQHGWRHVNHSSSDMDKHEFGVSRSLALQREDIRQGFQQMCRAFGDCFTPVFVPPYHGYDARTLRILDEEGFAAFSAGNRKFKKKVGLVELPAKSSFSRYDKGRIFVNTAKDVFSMVLRNASRCLLSGVVMHHADFRSAVSRRELVRFFALAEGLRDRKELEVLLFSDLLRK